MTQRPLDDGIRSHEVNCALQQFSWRLQVPPPALSLGHGSLCSPAYASGPASRVSPGVCWSSLVPLRMTGPGAHKSVLESANPHMDSECASGCPWSTAQGNSPVSGTADPRSSQTGQVIRGRLKSAEGGGRSVKYRVSGSKIGPDMCILSTLGLCGEGGGRAFRGGGAGGGA